MKKISTADILRIVALSVVFILIIASYLEHQSFNRNMDAISTQIAYGSTPMAPDATSTPDQRANAIDNSISTLESKLQEEQTMLNAIEVTYCYKMANLPKVEATSGGAYTVEDFMLCKDALGDKFPDYVAKIVARDSGAVTVISSYNHFHIFYNGVVTEAEKSEWQTINDQGVTKNHVSYDIPYYYLRDIKGIEIAECGSPYPDAGENVVVIYPCANGN